MGFVWPKGDTMEFNWAKVLGESIPVLCNARGTVALPKPIGFNTLVQHGKLLMGLCWHGPLRAFMFQVPGAFHTPHLLWYLSSCIAGSPTAAQVPCWNSIYFEFLGLGGPSGIQLIIKFLGLVSLGFLMIWGGFQISPGNDCTVLLGWHACCQEPKAWC